MAQNRVTLPDSLAAAVDLIEQRINHFETNGNGHRPAEPGSDDFGSGMVFGLREAEACILQAVVAVARES